MNEYKDNKLERDIPPDLVPLYNIVGDEKYDEIVDIYSGGYIYVPVSEKAKKKNRNSNIFEDYVVKGVTANVLARKYNLSNSSIVKIVAKEREKRMKGNS